MYRSKSWACGALSLLLTLFFCSCAASGSGGGSASQGSPGGGSGGAAGTSGGTGSGGLFEQIDRDLDRRQSAQWQAEMRAREEARREALAALPAGWKQKIDGWWAAWMRTPGDVDPLLKGRRLRDVDPQRLQRARKRIEQDWIAARGEWEALGPAAVNILAERLMSWYFRAYDRAVGFEVARARDELLRYREVVGEYLVVGLASGSGDSVLRQRMAELLALLGPENLPQIASALSVQVGEDEVRAIEGRWALVKALGEMRTDATLPLLERITADKTEPYKVRLKAIESLGELGQRRSLPALLRAVGDDDPSVTKFAAGVLWGFGDDSVPVLQALIGALERWGGRDPGVANAVHQALRRLARVDRGRGANVWRAWLRAREGAR